MTQTIVNLGTGGAVLNGRNGSTTGVDSNDALFLDWTGLDYVYLPGVAGNYLSVPDEAALDITGDIDIRVQVAMDDWTPGADGALLSKYQGAAIGRSYKLRIASSGVLSLDYTENGTNIIARFSTVATGIPDGAVKWVRVTMDVDNGASGNDVKFFLSDDGVTWTQLGTTVTTAGVTSIFSGNAITCIGAENFGGVASVAGKFYRAQIFNGIDGTKVLDVDTSVITSGAATSFTALTGQTVTINRSTSGRKAVAVVSPCWLFGTDDFMEVADNDLIDFGASDSFTVLAVIRQWATAATNGLIVNKGFAGVTANAGYSISVPNSTSFRNDVSDGTTRVFRDSTGYTAGTPAQVSLVVNRTAQTLTPYLGTTAFATQSLSAVGSLANAVPLRVGRSSNGTAYQDFELIAVAVFRRALTPTEISRITAYYQARLS